MILWRALCRMDYFSKINNVLRRAGRKWFLPLLILLPHSPSKFCIFLQLNWTFLFLNQSHFTFNWHLLGADHRNIKMFSYRSGGYVISKHLGAKHLFLKNIYLVKCCFSITTHVFGICLLSLGMHVCVFFPPGRPQFFSSCLSGFKYIWGKCRGTKKFLETGFADNANAKRKVQWRKVCFVFLRPSTASK